MPGNRSHPALPAPALLNSWPILLGLMLFLLVPFFLPIPMELRRHPLIGHLGDQVHVPFLMVLTLLIYWRGPFTGKLKMAIVGGMIIGGSIEFLQLLVGRSALWGDFFLDLAGISLASGLVIWKGHKKIAGLNLMVLMVLILSAQLYFLPGLILGSFHAQKVFPLISDFEGTHEHWLWSDTFDAQVNLVESDGNTVLLLESGPPSRWPGAQMKHFPNDWTGYKTLKLDVRHVTPDREKVPFSVRLDDYQTRIDQAWVSDYFKATTEWKTYSLPIVDREVNQGGRILNLKDMSYVVVFLSARGDSTRLEIDNIRLE